MALTPLFSDAFASGDFSSPQPKWTTDEWGASGEGRYGAGSYAWILQGTANVPSRSLGADCQGLHFGFGLKKTLITTGGNVLRLFDSATLHLAFALLGTGQLQVLRSTTVLATSAAEQVLSANVWCHIEGRVWIADTSGSVRLLVNGEEWLNYTGDTRNAGNASVNTFTYQNASNSGNIWISDLYIYQSTAFHTDPWVGDGRVFALRPSGAGTYTQWNSYSGTSANWQNVDEADPDDDGSYNSVTGSGKIDSYAFEDISGDGTVKFVNQWIRSRKDDAGTRTNTHFARSGGANFIGPNFNLGDTYNLFNRFWVTDPSISGSWTVSAINAAEFGQMSMV